MRHFTGVSISVILLLQSLAYADELSLHGFLQGNYSFNAGESNPDGGRYKWAEERGQIKAEWSTESVRIFIKTDLSYDHIDSGGDAEFREGYIDLSGPNWDMRVGRQIITWGIGDLIFINDIFPKDYEAFFSGRPMEYLKKGVDGVKAGLYPGFASIEVVAIPYFEPNNLPDPEIFHMFDPMAAVTDRVESKPASKPANTELALRVYRDIRGFDTSLYIYRGFYRNPSMRPDSIIVPSRIEMVYPEISVYGLSIEKGALGGVIGIEAGFYDSMEDRKGDDPMTPNSRTRFLVSYQRQLLKDLILGLQYLGEYMHDYSEYEKTLPPGFPKEEKIMQLASMRLTYLLLHQNLRLSWFSFWSPSDEDYLLNPEVRYNFSDHVWGAAGANIFGGKKDTTQFGSLGSNDNVYVQVRYEF